MTFPRLAVLFCLAIAGSAFAIDTAADRRDYALVIDEMAQTAQLPVAELSRLLADCDASPRSVQFCAWRDRLLTERALTRAIDRQKHERPGCARMLDARAADWRESRDRTCARSATRQWPEGPTRWTGLSLCTATATSEMTARVERMKGCADPFDARPSRAKPASRSRAHKR